MIEFNDFIAKKFKAYNNASVLDIIIKNENKEKLNNLDLFVIAGPNGSGKTTLIANLFKENIIKCSYINADLFCKTMFANIKDDNEKNLKSMYYTMNLVETFIKSGKSFCYETVLSHPSKLELIKLAKEKGYKITSIFVYTINPKINIERVYKRVQQGGHGVPEDKIISRFKRSLKLSKELERLSNQFYTFDNSKTLCELNAISKNKENENL